jgi:hypothetical protein
MAGWVIMPLLLVPLGGLAMYWAASHGMVPGLTPPVTLMKPADMLENVLELRQLAASAGAHMRSFQADVLTQLRRQEPSKPAVVEVPSLEVPPTVSLLSAVKITPVSAQTSSAKSLAVAQSTKIKNNDKEQKETQIKSVPSKANLTDSKATASLQKSTQTAQTDAVISSSPIVATAPSAAEINTEINPAGLTPGKAPAAPPSKVKLLAEPVQAKRPEILATTTSCRTEPGSEKRYASTISAQSSDRQTGVKPDQTDRASGVTFASMMSHAVNPLATGTALANSETLSTIATQKIPEGNISPEPAQTLEQAAFPVSFPQGSLGQMVKLRAELEQLKLQVHIEEVRQRLNQLKNQPGPVSPAPSLEFPPIGLPGPASDPADESPRRALRLLSIQSLNGKYTATLGTDSGPRVVRTNETVDGYRVVSISRNSVVINRGKGNEMLSIYE